MEEKKEKKRKMKGTKTRIAGKIIAAIMAIMMVLAACSTLIFYIREKVKYVLINRKIIKKGDCKWEILAKHLMLLYKTI